MKNKWHTFLALLLSLCLLSSCAIFGGGESGLKRASSYQLKAPQGWETLKTKGESDRAYRLPSGSAVSVISSCTKNLDTSLKVLTRQLLIGMREIKVINELTLLIQNGAGLYSSVKAKSEDKTVHLGVIVIKKEKCIFDFTLISGNPLSQKETAEFITFCQSLQYGSN